MKFSSLLLPVALFMTGVAAIPAAYAQAPTSAQAPNPGARQNPLLKGITLTADQKTKVQAAEGRFQTSMQQTAMQVQQKLMPQMQAIQSGAGTQQEKQAKGMALQRNAASQIFPAIRTNFNKLADEVGAVMTPAQKPLFNKNRTTTLAQMEKQFKAAQAKMK